MEAPELLHDLVDLLLGRQEGRAEVPRAVALAEARARDGDQARALEELQGVEGVRRHAQARGRRDGPPRPIALVVVVVVVVALPTLVVDFVVRLLVCWRRFPTRCSACFSSR